MLPAGGASVPVPGIAGLDTILRFRPDGRSLLLYRPKSILTRVEAIDLTTGARTLVRELAPVDPIGAVGFYGADVSRDEKAYVYCLDRTLGALYIVEGAR